MAFDVVLSFLDTRKVFERNGRPVSVVYKMFLQLPYINSDIPVPISEFGIFSTVLKEHFDFVYGDAHVTFTIDGILNVSAVEKLTG
ncbi:hypothetical protein JG687_00014014 [Phytophthora cactorum]|uniref:Uncharacterized protein n=1 Tax=Phytophthora cactorum TaxID=29920 RepID=A0A8T1TXY9_9STRA|nr:hypothetical protein JG687_00014014 [Phytophthora cactorum]